MNDYARESDYFTLTLANRLHGSWICVCDTIAVEGFHCHKCGYMGYRMPDVTEYRKEYLRSPAFRQDLCSYCFLFGERFDRKLRFGGRTKKFCSDKCERRYRDENRKGGKK